MSKYDEFKRLAKAARAYAEEDWHTPDRLFIAMEADDANFVSACSPSSVLALIAENESLRKDAERYRLMRKLTLENLEDTEEEFDAVFDIQTQVKP